MRRTWMIELLACANTMIYKVYSLVEHWLTLTAEEPFIFEGRIEVQNKVFVSESFWPELVLPLLFGPFILVLGIVHTFDDEMSVCCEIVRAIADEQSLVHEQDVISEAFHALREESAAAVVDDLLFLFQSLLLFVLDFLVLIVLQILWRLLLSLVIGRVDFLLISDWFVQFLGLLFVVSS